MNLRQGKSLLVITWCHMKWFWRWNQHGLHKILYGGFSSGRFWAPKSQELRMMEVVFEIYTDDVHYRSPFHWTPLLLGCFAHLTVFAMYPIHLRSAWVWSATMWPGICSLCYQSIRLCQAWYNMTGIMQIGPWSIQATTASEQMCW